MIHLCGQNINWRFHATSSLSLHLSGWDSEKCRNLLSVWIKYQSQYEIQLSKIIDRHQQEEGISFKNQQKEFFSLNSKNYFEVGKMYPISMIKLD